MEPCVSTLYAELDETRLADEVETLYRVAYRLTGKAHDAEDLVQDVCERALRQAPEFPSPADCRRWLLRVLYNRFVDERRQGRRSPIVAADAAGAFETARGNEPGPEEHAARTESESALVRAWGKLEPVQQMLLLLRAEGHDLDEIARISDIDKSVLSSRLHRARSSLAKHLNQEGNAEPLCTIPENAR
jgi:RNA polymerase sigma-70 factor (ECF subfamily)